MVNEVGEGEGNRLQGNMMGTFVTSSTLNPHIYTENEIIFKVSVYSDNYAHIVDEEAY